MTFPIDYVCPHLHFSLFNAAEALDVKFCLDRYVGMPIYLDCGEIMAFVFGKYAATGR
jgi:hypothetical protein